MKITTFNPLILTKDSASSLRLSASRNDTLSLSMRTEKTLQITA